MTSSSNLNEYNSDNDGTATTTRIRLLYASQSGRAKACARRVARTLQMHCCVGRDVDGSAGRLCSLTVIPPVSMDDYTSTFSSLQEAVASWQSNTIILFFISTTGDGEPPDNMKRTWQQL